MAYINPQYQIDMQQDERRNQIFKDIGSGVNNIFQAGIENRRRAIDEARKNKALELQSAENKRNEELYGKKINELNYLEGQRALDPLKRDEFVQKEAIAKIDAANELKKLQAVNQNARDLKSLEVQAKGPTLSEGEKAVDKDYSKQYNNFAGKGVTNTDHSIKKLEAIASELENDSGLIQDGGTQLPIPDMFRSKNAIRRRDEARNAANSTLKELFGAQLSDGERNAAAKEYYNDSLDNASNAKILRDKIQQLKANRAAELDRARYFEKNRTLKGYQLDPNRLENTSSAPSDGKAPWEKYK
jgi:hypothetical protein